MPEAHEGYVRLRHTFSDTWRWLKKVGRVDLCTSAGTAFQAKATQVTKGRRVGERVIRFFQRGREYGRAYECCWGYHVNCNGTWVGMYCQALDARVS